MSCAGDAIEGGEAVEEDRVINGVKGGREIKEDKGRDLLLVIGTEEVILNTE